MLIGKLLREKSSQYACKYDQKSKSYVVVDLWGEAIEGLEPDAEIPEKTITRISDGEARALMLEMIRLNKLPSSVREKAETPNEDLKETSGEDSLRSYGLKMKAIAAIEHVIAIDATQKLAE